MNTQNTSFIPKHVWVDSRVEGVGKSWYYGGKDQMTLDELQRLLNEHNACISYGDKFYNNVAEVPFRRCFLSVETYGMPTNMRIEEDPTVTVVPKGTRWDDSPFAKYIGSRRFVFPQTV